MLGDSMTGRLFPPFDSGRGGLARPRRRWSASLRRRLAVGFGALVLLMLLGLSVAGLQLREISHVTRMFAASDMQRLLKVQALALETEGVGVALVRLVNAPRGARVTEYTALDEKNRKIDRIIGSLDNELRDSGQQDTLQRLRRTRADYFEAFIATVDQVEAGDAKAAAQAINERTTPALKAMLAESNDLLLRERERIEQRLADVQAQFRRVGLWVAGFSLLALGVAAWLAWRTTRSVVRPLGDLKDAAQRITAGDYSGRVPATGTVELDRVGAAINTMADTVAQREREIARLAYEDPLTGLPNRAALLSPPAAAAVTCNTLALMDIARLKVINETLGHATGDMLIQVFAHRLAQVVAAASAAGQIGPRPMVARLSGGSFALAFQAVGRHAVEALRPALEDISHTAVHCSGHSVDLNFATGYADLASAGSQGAGVATLLRNAEVALHGAKRLAAGHAWYCETQEATRLSHLSLVSDLRLAVGSSQLQMWLQPKYALGSGKAVGAEALVRWQHPTRGFVSPAEFVPFAEQTGYIGMVTEWMLREALATLAGWRHSHPELSIAVNISARDLQDPGFARRVGELVLASGVNPARLRLEVTESGLMQDAQRSLALLHTLREIGTPLSIDDFGTGHSSLAYLQKMPVSELKIDRAFVERIDSSPAGQKLVQAVVDMGHGLGLTVTAEGVETEAERATIARLGCDVVQGYLTGKPLHGQALRDWLARL